MARPTVNMFPARVSKKGKIESDGGDYSFRDIARSQLDAKGLESPLQQGGSTYKTVWKTALTEKPVIVKILERLNFDQAERLHNVRHQNVVIFYGAIIEKPMYGIVLELCNGESLFDYLHKHKKPELAEAQKWARGIAMGMRYLHEYAPSAPVRHGNLTSNKVHLHNNNGNIIPKIGGFGYARRNTTTQNTQSVGKVQCFPWMAPELFAGQKTTITLASDVYSFSIILWELITGQVPYNKVPMFNAMRDIVEGKRPPVPKDCPRDWKELLEECWQGDPENRPTFNTILERLEFRTNLPQFADIKPRTPSVNADTLLSKLSKHCWENADYQKLDYGAEIGKGRMSVTHRATYHGKPIVAKTFGKHVKRNNIENYIYNYACSDLHHDNIVQILCGFSEQRVLIIEWMKTSLRQHLHETGPITDKKLLKSIAIDIARGLNHLHSLNFPVVHGGLTTRNVLLDEQSRAKISDIGYVFLDEASGHSATIYDDYTGGSNTTEGDVYSFGIVLIEMRAGEVPTKHSNQTYRHVSEVWPELYSLAKQCVTRHSQKRPSIKDCIGLVDRLE